MSNELPGAIAIAAKCVALDRVKVVPVNELSHTFNPEIRVLRIGNWEKRLIEKTVKHLTKQIERFCDLSYDKPIFKPFILYNPSKEGIWVYNDMKYDMIPN